MGEAERVPVTVVTGFLGAGKTTLVNQWLAETSRGDVAVIVNEHGTVGIDGELLAARVRALVEITGGCVCCRTQGELVGALRDLSSRAPRPKRILVETSGAASPAGVLRAIATGGGTGAFALDGVVTVVDAGRLDVLTTDDLVLEQLGYADVVVLSRADACSATTLAAAETRVAGHNGAATIASAARGKVRGATTLDGLLALRREDFVQTAHIPESHRHAYESVSLTLDGEVDGERFADFVETEVARFAGRLLRTKGILAVTGVEERMIVQGVADLVEVTFGAPWADAKRTSRMAIVGFGLDAGSLERAFATCAANAE